MHKHEHKYDPIYYYFLTLLLFIYFEIVGALNQIIISNCEVNQVFLILYFKCDPYHIKQW